VKSRKEESLNEAIKKEEGEKTFYMGAALLAKNDLTRMTFEELAREEDAHKKGVLDVYDRLKKDGTAGEWMIPAVPPFNPANWFQGARLYKVADCTDDLCALRSGLDMEERSIKYYEELAKAAEGTDEKQFYLALSYEERGHYLRIIDAIDYLNDPVGWHYVHQGSMEDGE
jgi:rubrerythrin